MFVSLIICIVAMISTVHAMYPLWDDHGSGRHTMWLKTKHISDQPKKKKVTEPVIFETILIHFEFLNNSAYIFSEVFRETHLTI